MVTETAGGSGEESRLRRGGEAHPRTAAARAAAAPGRLAARRLRAHGYLPWPASGDCERLDRSGGWEAQQGEEGAGRRHRAPVVEEELWRRKLSTAAGHGSSGAPPVRPLRQMEREKAGG